VTINTLSTHEASLGGVASKIFSMRNKRPPGLVAIVIYKTFVAIILAIAATAILLALQNYQSFTSLSETYILEEKLSVIDR